MQSYDVTAAVPASQAAALPTFASTANPDSMTMDVGTSTVAFSTTVMVRAARFATTPGTARPATVKTVKVATVHTRPAGAKSSAVSLSTKPAAAPDDAQPMGGGVWCSDYAPGSTHWIGNDEKFMHEWAVPNAQATVSQVQGSTHTLGVAMQVNGGGWGVHGSGSLTRNDSSGGTPGPYKTSHTIYNSVNYRAWNARCWSVSSVTNFRQARNGGFYDIFSKIVSIGENTYYWCVQKSGGTWWKNSGTNEDFSYGVSLPFISLEAEASFDKSTSITWNPTATVDLCGSTDQGWLNAPTGGVHDIHTVPTCVPGKPC